jgi:DNA-directed RNA polymerase subunit L
MKFVKKKTIELTREDVELIEYVAKHEATDQTNAIRIALREYKNQKNIIFAMRKLLEQQQEVIQLLKDGRG